MERELRAGGGIWTPTDNDAMPACLDLHPWPSPPLLTALTLGIPSTGQRVPVQDISVFCFLVELKNNNKTD